MCVSSIFLYATFCIQIQYICQLDRHLCTQAYLSFTNVLVSVSALTHIMQISHNFDIVNLPRYRDDNTLPHIARFRGKIQETLCKSREAVTVFLQNQGGDCFFYYHMQL